MAVAQRAVAFLVFLTTTSPLMVVGDEGCSWGKIPVNRVFDVQWSGNPSSETERAWSFANVYHPEKGRLSVKGTDYFTLTTMSDNEYQLKMFDKDGTLIEAFPAGKVKANDEVIFYIVSGWFGTIITKEDHKIGDRASYEQLQTNPSNEQISKLLGSCSTRATAICGKIPANRVFDVQWSGNPTSTSESLSGLATPYIPGVGRVDASATDYFTLSRISANVYELKHFGPDGTHKKTFPRGSIKANNEAIMYIIHGWFGTVLTKNKHELSDSIELDGLQTDPPESVLEEVYGCSEQTLLL